MRTLFNDLRYGARILLKKRGFTALAVLTLALGIGANTAIFSAVYALLLRPLPYKEPERLVMLTEKSPVGDRSMVSYPNFTDWRDRAQSFEGMASIRTQQFNLTGVDKPVRVRARTLNWNFFGLLGVNPQLGRSFVAEDDRYGAARTVLLSNAMWRERFAGDPGVVGKKLLLDAEPYEVIGVLPPGFEYFRADDLYLPIGLFLVPQTAMTDRGSSLGLFAVGRLKPGVTVAQANSEMATLGTQLASEYPAVNSGTSAMAVSLQEVMSEGVRESLWVLLGAVGFILLIACGNVANLLLVRAADRQKEIAVRLALGAGRVRIVRQLLSETLLIALLGGGAGLLAGRWMLDGLLSLAPENVPHLARVSLNSVVLLFTLGVATLTSLLCGLLPALHAARADLQTGLKEGGRSTIGAGRDRMRNVLLVVEVSLALVLLIGAGLLTRSMTRLLAVDPGFNPENLLTMRLMLTSNAYGGPRCRVFYDEALTRVRALPGVQAAALSNSLPFEGSHWTSVFVAADKPTPPRAELPTTEMLPVSAGYFETMGMRLRKGRWFTPSDISLAASSVVINETLWRRIWPDEDPIGKRLKQGWPESDTPGREVIGVVADVKLNGAENETPLQTYVTLGHDPAHNIALSVRTSGPPLMLAGSVEQAIHSIDHDLPVSTIRSMEQLIGNSVAQRRLTLTLLASFAALALLLAAVGVYGVISYSVKQRTHEIGVRLALGAQAGNVIRLVMKQGLMLTLLGVVIGLLTSFALTRLMVSLLFGVSATDPLTFSGLALLLLLVAALACWIPARRAAKVDPMIALRGE